MKNPKGCLIASVLWIIILGVLAVAARFYILPYFKGQLEDKTGSSARYGKEIALGLDSFSGYCILRSESLQNDLGSQGIRLAIRDDQSDVMARMKALQEGKLQMAVFTVDSLLTTGATLKEFPATIIMVIDETKGADAIVSYQQAVPTLDALDSPSARLVLTPQSPSEFLARTVIAHFNLPNLPQQWFEPAQGSEDVYQKFLKADRSARKAYVLWEPYVSRALEVAGSHLLIDSSKLQGHIVDVLVAERRFLRDNSKDVQAVVEGYLRAAYSYGQQENGMQNLVIQDAKKFGGETLSLEQANQLVKGIEWRNTLENYASFGLVSQEQAPGIPHIEDVLLNISSVLVKTGAFATDPIQGKANTLYHDPILREMRASSFHPSRKLNILETTGQPTDLEPVRTRAAIRSLSDQEWDSLVPIGRLRVESISFARGTARINIQSQRDLDTLAQNLEAWPQCYVRIQGNARPEGDPEANLQLARDRAEAAAQSLIASGIDSRRIKTSAAQSEEGNGSAQSVSFVLGQLPY